MKHPIPPLILVSLLSLLALAACGRSDPPAAAAPPASAPGPGRTAPTTGRPIEITANDAMKFNLATIRAKPGEALSVRLVNLGSMPKFSMGHNWILLQTGVNLEDFAAQGALSPKTDYVPTGWQDRILAATRLLGPGESDTVLFLAPTQAGRYPFLCSFPGHLQVGMKGELIVE